MEYPWLIHEITNYLYFLSISFKKLIKIPRYITTMAPFSNIKSKHQKVAKIKKKTVQKYKSCQRWKRN